MSGKGKKGPYSRSRSPNGRGTEPANAPNRPGNTITRRRGATSHGTRNTGVTIANLARTIRARQNALRATTRGRNRNMPNNRNRALLEAARRRGRRGAREPTPEYVSVRVRGHTPIRSRRRQHTPPPADVAVRVRGYTPPGSPVPNEVHPHIMPAPANEAINVNRISRPGTPNNSVRVVSHTSKDPSTRIRVKSR